MIKLLIAVLLYFLSFCGFSSTAILYEDGSYIPMNCSTGELIGTFSRLINADPMAVFDYSWDSPIDNLLESYSEMCAWRIDSSFHN